VLLLQSNDFSKNIHSMFFSKLSDHLMLRYAQRYTGVKALTKECYKSGLQPGSCA